VAPLAAVNATRRPTQATYLPTLLPTAKARNDSVEWTVNESKKPARLSQGASAAGPWAAGHGHPNFKPPSPPSM
jgi:hypothetical protein